MILEGIKVLDFTQYLAGPTVTRLMAEMGARVIKVERAPDGDPARALPAVKIAAVGILCSRTWANRVFVLTCTALRPMR